MKYSVDIDELGRLYTVEGLTTRQIGARVGIPPKTIHRYLRKAGVQLRNPGYPVIDRLTDREWLYREYWGLGKSTTEIAAGVGCSWRSVSLWLQRHGIKARSTGSTRGHQRNDTDECREKMSKAKRGKFIGSDNPNWRGGVQIKHPERNRYPSKMWVKAVKDRDGWRCVKCDATDRLHAHHIKRWKDYPELRYDPDNGVTLCHTCHEAAHGVGFKFRWTQASQNAHERIGHVIA